MELQRMWDYYQTEGLEAFSGADRRLSFLLKMARRVVGKRRVAVLNIGVGNGWMERASADLGWETSSLDPSPEAIRRVAALGISAEVGVVESIPFSNDRFDIVFCSEVFEHLSEEQLQKGLQDIRRVLKRGGILVGSVPCKEILAEGRTVCPCCGTVFHRWGHLQAFSAARLATVLREGGLLVRYVRSHSFPEMKMSVWSVATCAINRLMGRMGIGLVSPSLVFVARK